MTITKKEKILIFVLIIFLLVGGIYTLGIMNQKSAKTATKAETEAIKTDINAQQARLNQIGESVQNRLKAQIASDRAELAKLSSPGVDVNAEVQSGNLPGLSDSIDVQSVISTYFADNKLVVPQITVQSSSGGTGRIIYRVATNFTCDSYHDLYLFIDKVAQHQSYNITSLTRVVDTKNDDGYVTGVSGSLQLTITYLNIESA